MVSRLRVYRKRGTPGKRCLLGSPVGSLQVAEHERAFDHQYEHGTLI